jgi:hypothetical protein
MVVALLEAVTMTARESIGLSPKMGEQDGQA